MRLITKANIWTRGLIVAGLAIVVALVLAFHGVIPNSLGNLGSLVETFLPWLAWVLIPLAVLAAIRRSATAGIAIALTFVLWATMFVDLLPNKGDGRGDLRVLTHNVDVDNQDISSTVATLVDTDSDVIALEELDETAQTEYEADLKEAYPYSQQYGTVGLWSKYPISDASGVDINIGWTRAMRARIETPAGEAAVYVAHLASVRVGSDGFTSEQRDSTAQALGDAISNEDLEHVVLLGDLNGTVQDRSLAPVTYQLTSTQAEAGSGFGFSWPAAFPMSRIDQILVRGVTVSNSWTVESTGSDHLPIAADLRL